MRDLAIRNTHPSVVSINAGVEAWDKDGNTVTLDESLIQAEVIRLQELYVSQEYARLRKAEYDQLNQFEMQFDDNRDGTTTWVDAVNSIKARYPK
jgi:hypothetical protein